jgi:hypothetical protein
MNFGPETRNSALDDQIDRTLHLIGSANPRPGIEKRIAARLALVPAHAAARRSARFFGIPRLALASAAGLLASVAIIAASVNHSRHLLPIAPGLQMPGGASGGIDTASGKAVAPKPVTPPAHGRPRFVRKAGATDAKVSSDAQKPDGVAVPKNPLPR